MDSVRQWSKIRPPAACIPLEFCVVPGSTNFSGLVPSVPLIFSGRVTPNVAQIRR
jgi:hypothetical protein